MAQRLSTQIINQLGARRNTVTYAGRLVNAFQDATGAEKFFNAANIALGESGLVSDSLNIEEFYVAKSFFVRHGVSDTVAISMAVLSLDTAKIMGVSVMKALQPLNGTTQMVLSFETLVAGNYLRPASSKQTYLVAKDNADSLRSRDIVA